MTTDRMKREGEVVRAVWAVTAALLVGSFGFVISTGGPSADETVEALDEAAPEPLLATAGAPLRVPVAPAAVSLPAATRGARRAPAPTAAPKPAVAKPAAVSSPRQVASAPVPGVASAPAPAPRRVVVVRRSRAS